MMRNRLRIAGLSLLGFMLAAVAGEIHSYKCTNTVCHFEAKLLCGGGDAVSKVSGYCVHCGKIVAATFPHKNRVEIGRGSVGRAWDAATGRMLDLFECPGCKHPFASVEKMNFCPKCGGRTMAEGPMGLWD